MNHHAEPDWHTRALCLGMDADVFFPEPGDVAATNHAKRICTGCPVRQACLTNALREEGGRAKDNRFGVRGGKAPGGRYAMYTVYRKQQQHTKKAKPEPKKRETAKCGTRGGYKKHQRENTEICPPCRQANTDADNRLRRTGTSKALA
jgi:hypothetical protein